MTRQERTEAQLGAELTSVMRAQGAMVYPLVASQFSPDGWPDKLVWHAAWQGLMELKGPGTPWRPGQCAVLKRLWERKPGGAWLLRWDHARGLWGVSRGDSLAVTGVCGHEAVLHHVSNWRES